MVSETTSPVRALSGSAGTVTVWPSMVTVLAPASSTLAWMVLSVPTKVATKRVCGPVVDLERRAELLDVAGVQHDDAVGDRQRLFLVVRHEDGGDAELALDGADFFAQADTRIFASSADSGSSSSSMRGPRRESAGQRDALLLAARELEREALAVAGQADELEHLLDARLALRPAACRRS